MAGYGASLSSSQYSRFSRSTGNLTGDIDLERSPSLMSHSSGRSTPPPITPDLSLASSRQFNTSSSHYAAGKDGLATSARTAAGAASIPTAPQVFGYQAKLLNRTSSIQSISSLSNGPQTSLLPRGPGSISSRALNDVRTGSATTTANRWTPGHRPSASASIDDVVGRFGGGSGRTTPTSAATNNNTTWRRTNSTNSLSRSTSNLSSLPNDENAAPTSWRTRQANPAGGKSAPTSPTANGGRSYTSFQRVGSPEHDTRPLSPTSMYSGITSGNSLQSHSFPATPIESEIMSSKSYSSGLSSQNGTSHRGRQQSIDLGGVQELSKSSVGLLHGLKDYATAEQSSGSRPFPSSGAGMDRQLSLRSSQSHRRTKTLPEADLQATINTPGSHASISRPFSPDNDNDDASRFGRSRAGGRLGMHGLDRVSERSDTSDVSTGTINGLRSGEKETYDEAWLARRQEERAARSRPSSRGSAYRPTSPVSQRSQSRNAQSHELHDDDDEHDLDKNPAGAIVIPGITTGASSVAGMNNRKRLTRVDTVSGAHGSGYTGYGYGAAKAMDTQRRNMQAYEYLCHVSEAKEWLVLCLTRGALEEQQTDSHSPNMVRSPTLSRSLAASMSSPIIDPEDPSGLAKKSVVELEEALRDGVALAKLARVFLGKKAVPRIIENIRHKMYATDNINVFFGFTRHTGLPDIFCFETTDLYDAKNLPKVIYCIHALSHLLARQGLADRIGDHLNKIEFTDEELERKQRGLDAAGVSMPSFGNIGRQLAKEIEEEPEETEEEVQERLRQEQELRAAQLRHEEEIRMAQLRHEAEVRAQRVREEQEARQLQAEADQRRELQAARPYIVALQSEARKFLARRHLDTKLNRLQRATRTYIAFQAQCRGKLAHASLQHTFIHRQQALQSSQKWIAKFQGRCRGVLLRRSFFSQIKQLEHHDHGIVSLQAHIRGRIARQRLHERLQDLDRCTAAICAVQAAIRGVLARKRVLNRVQALRAPQTQTSVAGLQSVARRRLARQAQERITKQMTKVEVVRSVGNMQAFARGALTRKRQQQQSKALGFVMPDVVGVQAQVRGYLIRRDFWLWHEHLEASHEQATRLQALLLGAMARRRFWRRLAHYHHNVDKVVKIQAIYRRKQQLQSYQQLMKGTNIPLMTIKNFVHLLSDNDNDYREVVEVEHLKKTVITKIRANQQLEADVGDLDIKIALLVKNKMSLDEIERARRLGSQGTIGHKQRHSVLAAAGDPFALASLDKATLRKLELYQQMFYLLQTKPEYLARLFCRLSTVEMSDRQRKAVEGVVLTLFGYAQNSREEFLLLKLFQRSIHEEVMSIFQLTDFDKGDFVFIKLVLQYGRGAKERKYLQDLLAPLVKDIVNDDGLDLETDPLALYRASIAREEMDTGLASTRPQDVTHQQALEDPDTRMVFIRHLKLLRAKTDLFLEVIFASTGRIPFGMRYIAREIFRALEIKFGRNDQDALIRQVGHFLYYRYINPAIVAPESFDVVNATIGAPQRKNLAAISKMLNQISVARHFADENPYLSPLNEYVTYGSQRFKAWFYAVLDVPDAETQFNADEYLDHSLPHKPIIYISPNEIYSMHSLVVQHLDVIAVNQRDHLRSLVEELGGAPLPASAELEQARTGEIAMTLKGRLQGGDDMRTEEKTLFAATKRFVLYLMKVQPAENLMTALVEPVSHWHEEAWHAVAAEEVQDVHNRMKKTGSSTNLEDMSGLTFREVKARCLENMIKLEQLGRVKRSDNFQDVLNAIAQDIRNKHRKRIVRQREIQAMEGTISSLDDKHKYLEQQIDAFKSFVDSTKTTIQKKGKKRLVMPFSSQYFHRRELEKSGKLPKFGSYKYTARNLSERGILLSIEGFSPRQYDNISIAISSDEVGVFVVEAFMLGVPVPDGQVELSMDELLQAQFNGIQTLSLGGIAKCSLNLLLSFINRKFYA